MDASSTQMPPRLALVGAPNCGKTALFNALTGSRQKVGNYAGVTVERKVGTARTPEGRILSLIDLPGPYSLRACSPDEEVTRDIVLGQHPREMPPDLILVVVDATNMRSALRLVSELREVGRPILVVLNITATAVRRAGLADLLARLDSLIAAGLPTARENL